jgi:signal transduction histidine kinase
LAVLREVKTRFGDLPVIMFTNTGTEEVAVEAMKAGLDDYVIKKPTSFSRLPLAVKGVLSRAAAHRRAAQLEHDRNIALEQERAARTEAEAAVRLRDEFLAIAAHELKTPVTALLASADLMLRRLDTSAPVDEVRLKTSLTRIIRQAEKLTSLVHQLLDISQIEAGRLVIVRRPTNVTQLVHDVAAAIQTGTTIHTLKVNAPQSVVATIDAVRIEQVLTNLLDNSVRYSPDGGLIEITILSMEEAVDISVRDYGLGVQKEHREYIFDRFYQADPQSYRGGFGLGLYISRQIVDLHNGELRASFPQDGGTSFTIHLPGSVIEASTEVSERLVRE